MTLALNPAQAVHRVQALDLERTSASLIRRLLKPRCIALWQGPGILHFVLAASSLNRLCRALACKQLGEARRWNSAWAL